MWAHEILGISADADERAVKRAYAARLKSTRPDDDPAGFQRLVEARDAAIGWARSGLHLQFQADFDDDDDEEADGADGADASDAGPAEQDREHAAAAPEADDSTTVEGPFRLEDRLPSGDPPLDLDEVFRIVARRPPSDERSEARPETVVLGDPLEAAAPDGPPEAVLRGEPLEPAAAGDPPEAVVRGDPPEPPPETPPPVDSPPAGDAPPEVDEDAPGRLFADLVGRVEALATPAGLADAAGWKRLVEAAEALDITRRLQLESRIATTLDRALTAPSSGGPSRPDPARLEAAKAAVAALDQGFGWTHDVRRLARMIGGSPESRPLVAAIEAIAAPAAPIRRTDDGFPLIEPFDLDAFFGTAGTGIAAYYGRARRQAAFPLSWSWTAFLFPSYWLARQGFPWIGVGLTVALVALIAAAFEPLRSAQVARNFVSVMFVVMAARAAFACQASRIQILRLAGLVERADRETPGRNERRRSFLAERRSGRRWVALGIGGFFLLMVDVYPIATVVGALRLPDSVVREHAAGRDIGSLFERMSVHSLIEHRRRSLARIDALTASSPVLAASAEVASGIHTIAGEARRALATAKGADYWTKAEPQVGRVEAAVKALSQPAR